MERYRSLPFSTFILPPRGRAYIRQKQMNEDTLRIVGLQVEARIGCSVEERSRPQPLEVSLSVPIDVKRAASSIQLEETVCWGTLSQAITTFITTREWILVEELCESLSEHLLNNFERIGALELEVRKFPPLGVRYTAIKIRRERGSRDSRS